MPSANGEAEVNSKRGTIEVKAEFGNLQSPTTFGNEYLTYILWAISPEGRAVNLGEVLVGGNSRSKLNVTTDLQAFALDRYRGTLLCGSATQQCGGARKCHSQRHQGHSRNRQCEVRTDGARRLYSHRLQV